MTPRQVAMLAAIAAIWGASYLLIKIALDGFSPAAIVFVRVALAALILWLVILLRGGAERESLSFIRRRPGRAALQGLLSVALPFMLISFGETAVPSGLTGVLVAPGPLFVALFAPLLDRSERVDGWGWAGLLLGFAGVGLLVGIDSVGSADEFLGAIAIVGAAASYGLGSMNVRLSLGGLPPLVVSFLACATAAAMSLPLAVPGLVTRSPDLGEIAAVICLGAIGTALAFVIYFALIQQAGAGRASLVGYLVPPMALAYGALLLDERITAAAIAGLLLILGGVAIAGRRGPGDVNAADPPPEPA